MSRPASKTRAATVVIAVAAIGAGLFWLMLLALRASGGGLAEDAWAFDLAAYVGAAQRLIDEGSLYAQELVNGHFEPGPANLFYYAPPLGVAMLPFTAVDIADGAWLWWVVRIGALLLSCALMPVSPRLRAFAFAVAAFTLPALKDSVLGNVSLLLLLPLVAGWRWMDRPQGSIALAAAISVRPGLGILLIWQFLRRQWRAALWTTGAGIALIVVTLPFVGVDGYRDYLAVLGNLSVPIGASENRDLGSVAFGLGADASMIMLARVLGVLVGIGAILASLRRDREIGYMVTLSASLLLVPLLWDHYLATLVIPAAFLAQRLWTPFLLLPLLAWVPSASAFVVLGAMLLPLLVRDDPEAATSTLASDSSAIKTHGGAT